MYFGVEDWSSEFSALQVCTKLARGGPNNATYVTAYTILDREHAIQVGIEDIGTQLTGVYPPYLLSSSELSRETPARRF